jgi:hypothetical protein
VPARRVIVIVLVLMPGLTVACGGPKPTPIAQSRTTDTSATDDSTPDTSATDDSIPDVSISVPDPGRMYGTITWPDGSPMSDVTVTFSDQDGEVLGGTVTTGDDGSYTLTGANLLGLDAALEGLHLTCPSGGVPLAQSGNLCNLPLLPTPTASSDDDFLAAPSAGQEVDWQAAPAVIDASLAEQSWGSGVTQDESNGSSTWQDVKDQS